MRTRTAVFVGAMLVMLAPTVARAQVGAVFDHLKCYRIKDPALKTVYLADLLPDQQPPFSVERGCKVKVPAKLFCIDVVKTNVQPPPAQSVPGTTTHDFLCYKIACPKGTPFPTAPLMVKDQFGQREVTIKKPGLLCTPAEKVPDHHACTMTAAGCTGTCPLTGDQCVFGTNPNTGVVECGCFKNSDVCQPSPPAGTPCTSLRCPDPIQDCILDAVGCHCQDRPTPCGFDRTAGQCGGTCPNSSDDCLVVQVNTDGTGNCQCVPHTQACAPGGTCPGLCPKPLQTCNTPAPCSCQ
jgi:hypothetical protein